MRLDGVQQTIVCYGLMIFPSIYRAELWRGKLHSFSGPHTLAYSPGMTRITILKSSYMNIISESLTKAKSECMCVRLQNGIWGDSASTVINMAGLTLTNKHLQ